MTITKRIGIFFFLFFSALTSCKKKDNDIIIDGRYKPSSVTNIDEVVMYSHQGQIKQTALIKDFLTRKSLNDFFSVEKKTELTDNFTSTYVFDFRNDGTVNTSARDFTPFIAEIVNRTPTYLDIAAIDSTTYFLYNSNSRCQTLASIIATPIPQKKEYHIPTTSGYSTYYKFRPMLRFEILSGQLYLPIISHLTSYSTANDVTCHSYSGGVNGTFNRDILQQLKPGDTILYQAKRTMLIKQ